MRFTMLQLLRNLRSHSQGKEMRDADILKWANRKVRSTGRTSHIESFKVFSKTSSVYLLLITVFCNRTINDDLLVTHFFIYVKDKSLSSGLFFLELLSAVEPRLVNWNLVTKGESGMIPFKCYHFI